VGHALTVLDASSLETIARVDLPREPRGVLVDDDGRRAFVTHLVGGRVSVVDLTGGGEPVHDVALIPENREVRDSIRARRSGRHAGDHPTSQGYAISRIAVEAGAPARILAPVASMDPGPPEASLSYGGSVEARTVTPLVPVIDPRAERVLPRTRRVDFTSHRRECLLPRAAAATTGGLLVACQGIDALLELDPRSLDPVGVERRRFPVPAGPTGVAVDADHGRAVVWSQFARELAVVSLASPREERADLASAVQRIPAAHKATSRLSAKEQLGRRLFFTTDDPRISHDGRACASCHPDGRDDSLTWSTPDGPRQTIMLAGRVAGSEPYGWFGKNRSLRDHVAQSWKRLGGTGLLGAADREDLDGLLAWIAVMPAPRTAGAVRDPAHAALAARGRDVFLDPAQGCSNCHLGGGTDKAAHDVQSGDVLESSLLFDTPSLRFVGGTAPYFHDGRYATLEALLERSDGKMGHTIGLPRPDLLALVAYLEDL
jgi:DNA-binding beta-propeller fold protein YncE